jgi:hypothetical protein
MASPEEALQFRNIKPALIDGAHPDQRLASLIARNIMIRLPLLDRDFVFRMLTADIPSAVLDGPAEATAVAQAIDDLLGTEATLALEHLDVPAAPRLRDMYASIIKTDEFCAACGRISASYAW